MPHARRASIDLTSSSFHDDSPETRALRYSREVAEVRELAGDDVEKLRAITERNMLAAIASCRTAANDYIAKVPEAELDACITQDGVERTLLQWCAAAGNESMIHALLERGAAVDAANRDGASPAMQMCVKRNVS